MASTRGMRRMRFAFVATVLIVWFNCLAAMPPKLQADKLERILQIRPTYNEQEKVLKFSFPRTDVKPTIDGVKLPPFMGLTTWCAFEAGMRKPAIVAGDIVLFEDEVNPVMSAALEKNLSVTALHNHFFYDQPRVYFMHIGGEGDPVLMADAVRGMLEKIKDIRKNAPEPATRFEHAALADSSTITAAPLDEIFGEKGQAKDGMYKIAFGRQVEMPCGCKVGKEMGVNTWAAFYGADDHALVDGDFVCAVGELQAVLKSLRQNNINIVAIHNHMETEAPRMIFLHYWGIGKAADLARAVQAARETQPKLSTQPTE